MLTVLRRQLRPAASALVVFTVLAGLLYPLMITAVAQALFPDRANGSVILLGGRPVGSELIGQPFGDPRYFWDRPSATPRGPYNASASSGSNLGPGNPELARTVSVRLAMLHAADTRNTLPVPVDLVTASGSGLDPHISPAAARLQVARVAAARALSEDQVRAVVERSIEPPQFGFLGEPRVNVLVINLALDRGN
jgi:K+-transporting ATPase ATPase C chain